MAFAITTSRAWGSALTVLHFAAPTRMLCEIVPASMRKSLLENTHGCSWWHAMMASTSLTWDNMVFFCLDEEHPKQIMVLDEKLHPRRWLPCTLCFDALDQALQVPAAVGCHVVCQHNSVVPHWHTPVVHKTRFAAQPQHDWLSFGPHACANYEMGNDDDNTPGWHHLSGWLQSWMTPTRAGVKEPRHKSF